MALVEDYQIPLLMEPIQKKATKVSKLNQEQQKQVGVQGKAMLEKAPFQKFATQKVNF